MHVCMKKLTGSSHSAKFLGSWHRHIQQFSCISMSGILYSSCSSIGTIGWTSWSGWGTCSSTCGIGTQSRTRTCQNPLASALNSSCTGDSTDYRTCTNSSCKTLIITSGYIVIDYYLILMLLRFLRTWSYLNRFGYVARNEVYHCLMSYIPC